MALSTIIEPIRNGVNVRVCWIRVDVKVIVSVMVGDDSVSVTSPVKVVVIIATLPVLSKVSVVVYRVVLVICFVDSV